MSADIVPYERSYFYHLSDIELYSMDQIVKNFLTEGGMFSDISEGKNIYKKRQQPTQCRCLNVYFLAIYFTL